MKRFLETKLFNLLSCSVNGKEVDRIELSIAYDDFVRHRLLFCQEEQNVILLCFAINYTVAEVKELNMRLEIENDYSSLEIRLLLAKVLSILDSTFRVVQFRLNNPDLFPINIENYFAPDVYLANDVDMIDMRFVLFTLRKKQDWKSCKFFRTGTNIRERNELQICRHIQEKG